MPKRPCSVYSGDGRRGTIEPIYVGLGDLEEEIVGGIYADFDGFVVHAFATPSPARRPSLRPRLALLQSRFSSVLASMYRLAAAFRSLSRVAASSSRSASFSFSVQY